MKRVLVVLAAILLAFLVWRASVLHRKIIAANEYAVVAHLRAVLLAQYEYQNLSGGYFGNLECLVHPASCLGVDASDSEPLLDASVLAKVRGSYRFVFSPRREPTLRGASREQWKAEVKRRKKNDQAPLYPFHVPGFTNYAYKAIPRYPGITGELGFCIVSNGSIYGYLPDELHLLEVTFPECLEAPSQCRDFHRCGEEIWNGVPIKPHPKAADFFPEIPAFPKFLKPYVRDTILLGLAVPLCAIVLWIKRKIFRP